MTYNDPAIPKAYSKSVTTGFGGANLISFTNLASFIQIANESTHGDAVQVQLNGDSACIFPLGAGNVQIFDTNDLYITSIDFAPYPSGFGAVPIEVIAGIRQG